MTLAFASALFSAGAIIGGLLAPQDQQPLDDPEIRAAVERFYAAQEAEDVAAYLALWSPQAQRPNPAQLEYIFNSGDDRFTNITLQRLVRTADRVRVRVSVTRERTISGASAPGTLRVSAVNASLTFVREDGEWKLLREGTAADDLAGALIDAASPAERAELLASEPDAVGRGLLDALGRRASGAVQRGLYAEAEPLFRLLVDVARLTGERAAEGEALQNLANSFYFRGRHAEALVAYEQRLALERARADEAAIAAALLGIATVRYAYAEYGAALSAYREALAIQERLADLPGLATTLLSTGNVLYMQGDYDAAIADYRRSLTLSRETQNVDAASRALEGLGRVFTAQGDLGGALEAFSGVLADAASRADRGRQAVALQRIGEIQLKLGNLDEARASFEASRAHYEARHDAANAGRVLQGTALTDLVASRFELAEKEYTASGAVCSGAADAECVARATIGLAFAQGAQEKFTQAIASYARAIEAFTALGRPEEAARAEIGSCQAYAGQGDLDAALAAAVRARRSAVALGAEDVLWRALLVEARVLRKKGDAAALGAARAAAGAVERLRQAADERPGSAAPADGDAAFATLAVIQAEAGDAAAAFRTAEQMRLYRLRTTLAPYERDVARGATAEERKEERAAAARLVPLGAQLARERALPKPDPVRVERLEREQADAAARRAAQQRRLFERLPQLRAWRALGRAADSLDLECVLTTDGTVFIEFVADEDDLLTLVAARRGPGISLHGYITPTTRRALGDRVAALLQPATLRSVRSWDKAARELVSLLPADAVARLSEAAAAVIVPDAALWRVPFEALRVRGAYLADRASVAYSSSLTAALQAHHWAAPRPRAHPLMTVVAPDISPAVRDRALSTAPRWLLRAREIGEEEVAQFAPREAAPDSGTAAAVALRGPDATEARVRERAADARRLHFASPFRVNAASPLFSPLLLAGEAPEAAGDGVLEAREILNLDLAATVAVLSDGSALAMRDAARALDAIEWAWRSAGVPALVVARWGAEPAASQALLAGLHTRLAAGETPGAALRAAAAGVRAAASTTAPYYWAGWLLIAEQPGAALPVP